MKKIFIATLVSGLISSSMCHAGAMGPASTQGMSNIFFGGIEGSYTWNQTDPFTFNSRVTSQTNQNWGGRLSLGVAHPVSDNLRFSAELGGGYYGSTTLSAPLFDSSCRGTLDGYDLLVGAIYKLDRLDVFGNVGFMSLNNRIDEKTNLTLLVPGGFTTGFTETRYNQTQTLPEIKVGGIYNLNDRLGVSLSYMHLFGTKVSNVSTETASAAGITQNWTINVQNPTLDSVLLGLRYSIA